MGTTRTVTYGAACSLDGFITGPGGALDWLQNSADASAILKAYFEATDTLIFGRKTWEFDSQMMGGSPMPGVRTILCSRTLTKSPHPNVELVRDGVGDFVRTLKREKGKGIIVMSGGNLAGSLFAADVIDEVGLNVHPVLLGSGTPLFTDPGQRVNLKFRTARAIAGGCVMMTYGVKHSKK